MPLLERFQVTATCRASFAMYNTREEIDHLVDALIKARDMFAWVERIGRGNGNAVIKHPRSILSEG
jgi:hypothetical protein